MQDDNRQLIVMLLTVEAFCTGLSCPPIASSLCKEDEE